GARVLLVLRPPRPPLFPTRRSSDLVAVPDLLQVDGVAGAAVLEPDEVGVGGVGVEDEGRVAVLVVEGDALLLDERAVGGEELAGDRESTRLDSSHVKISYAVFCLQT